MVGDDLTGSLHVDVGVVRAGRSNRTETSAEQRDRLGWAPLTEEQRAEQLARNLEDLGVI
jgi:hypothetical protein